MPLSRRIVDAVGRDHHVGERISDENIVIVAGIVDKAVAGIFCPHLDIFFPVKNLSGINARNGAQAF